MVKSVKKLRKTKIKSKFIKHSKHIITKTKNNNHQKQQSTLTPSSTTVSISNTLYNNFKEHSFIPLIYRTLMLIKYKNNTYKITATFHPSSLLQQVLTINYFLKENETKMLFSYLHNKNLFHNIIMAFSIVDKSLNFNLVSLFESQGIALLENQFNNNEKLLLCKLHSLLCKLNNEHNKNINKHNDNEVIKYDFVLLKINNKVFTNNSLNKYEIESNQYYEISK